MTQLDKIEEYFFQARRSAFIISFLCFIGIGISLSALATMDLELAIMKPALFIMVLTLFTLFFLLLAFRLFQPIGEIVKMVNTLYDDIMKDEELEPVGAGAETEREKLAELTQQIGSLKKEISVLKKQVPSAEEKQVPSAEKRDRFWPTLILEWLSGVVLVCGVLFMIPDLQNMVNISLAMAFVVIISIIALVRARNEGRLKWLSRLRWPRRPKWLGGDAK